MVRLASAARTVVPCLALLAATCGNPGGPPDDGMPDGGSEPLGMVTGLGRMVVPRALHSATELPNGLVLITGGGTPETPLRAAELYDPEKGGSRAVDPLPLARMGHTATLLPNGSVLIVGGFGSGLEGASTADLFDSRTERLAFAGRLAAPHGDGHAAIRLANGNVLILGGDLSGTGRTPTAAAELYDPVTGVFTLTSPMLLPRRTFGVVLLRDGRVLVAGGTTSNQAVTASAELYDPATGRFTATGSLRTARHKHAGVLLSDGRVLILGGTTGGDDRNTLTSAEIYDPDTGAFTQASSLLDPRYKFSAVTLPNGWTLAIGGSTDLMEVSPGPNQSFHPVAGAPEALRLFPASTLLKDGSVLVSGGYGGGGAQATVWRFRP